MGDCISMSISVDSPLDETSNRGPLALLLLQLYEFSFGINTVQFSILFSLDRVGDPDGYIYDFWKERYPDDDYGNQPDRKANPRPLTPTNVIPMENTSPGQAPNSQTAAKTPKKTKFCTIL